MNSLSWLSRCHTSNRVWVPEEDSPLRMRHLPNLPRHRFHWRNANCNAVLHHLHSLGDHVLSQCEFERIGSEDRCKTCWNDLQQAKA